MVDTNWQDVGAAADLAARPLTEITLGRARLALSHRNGVFGVISGVCNHVGGPLGQGRLDGNYVVCPWHNWKFHRVTGIGEPGGQSHRVSVLALPVEVTLHQPDGGTTPDVDGRIEVHHADASSTQRTKLARMPSPTAPDFSGWNWVPHTAPRSAEAVTAPPYSQVDVVSAVRSGANECTK